MKSPSQGIPRNHTSEPVKRLSLKLPESLHTRFRTACSATNRKMMSEIQKLVAHRTEELEEQAGLNEWADRLARRAQSTNLVERRLHALERALGCNHPTGNIDEMLADIERGRDLR